MGVLLATRGLDLIIGIDTSKSMLATDVEPNRLTRAKLAAQDLIGLSQGDRLGRALWEPEGADA